MKNGTLSVTYRPFFLVLHIAAAGQKFTQTIKFAAAFNDPIRDAYFVSGGNASE